MSTPGGQEAVASPVLNAAQLAEIAEFGAEQPMTGGQLLFEAGESSYDLFVVLEGEVEIVAVSGPDDDGAEHEPIFVFGPGNFVGELNLLTGQRRFLTARVSRAGPGAGDPPAGLPPADEPAPGARRNRSSARCSRAVSCCAPGEGAQAIRIIGSRYSPEAMSLRSFAEHSRLAHTWIDVEDAEDVEALLSTHGPVPARTCPW